MQDADLSKKVDQPIDNANSSSVGPRPGGIYRRTDLWTGLQQIDLLTSKAVPQKRIQTAVPAVAKITLCTRAEQEAQLLM